MPRPRLPIGTYGSISVRELPSGKYEASARYRFSTGKFKRVKRTGVSENKAVNNLKRALKTIDRNAGGSISPKLRLSALADKFMEAKEAAGRSRGTLQTYQVAIDAHIKPDIGELAIGEATTERLGSYIKNIHEEHGYGAAKNLRSVLSGMMSLAAANGAVDLNPVASVERIEKGRKPGSRPLKPEELGEFIKALDADEVLNRRGYADIFKLMAGTGFRMGEACGLCWDAIDFEHNRIEMKRIAKYINGEGAVLQEGGKTETSARTISVADDIMRLLKHRREGITGGYDLVFANVDGGVLDPNNVERALRERRDALGYPGITSHSLRKCVATMLDKQGLNAREIADYLGHAKVSMTQDVYLERNRDSGKAAGELQALLPHGLY
jgi:integrase